VGECRDIFLHRARGEVFVAAENGSDVGSDSLQNVKATISSSTGNVKASTEGGGNTIIG
jgi:hypothetical protein